MKELFNGIGTGFGTIFIILIIAVIVLLLLTGWLILRLNRLQYRMQVFMRGKDGKSLEQNIIDRLQEIDKMSGRVNIHHSDLVALGHQINSTLTHYGIVKYDAFDDVGGKLSFVLAMLDDRNTGFVLDAIHSRDNCFVYLKEIVNGESYIMLSEEEMQALRMAAGSDEENELEI